MLPTSASAKENTQEVKADHAPTDTVEKIEYELLEKRTRLIFHTAWEIVNREGRLRLKE